MSRISLGRYTNTLDQRLFDAATNFFSDYEPYPFAATTLLPDGFFNNVISNAEGVETYSLEVETQFEASDQVTLTDALGLLHAEVTSFDSSANDFAGNELPRATEFDLSLGFNYEVTDRLDIRGQLRHTGATFRI